MLGAPRQLANLWYRHKALSLSWPVPSLLASEDHSRLQKSEGRRAGEGTTGNQKMRGGELGVYFKVGID